MISGVEVKNIRTEETVYTAEDGRYTIAANKKDKIFFKKKGYKMMVLTVNDQLTANIKMVSEN